MPTAERTDLPAAMDERSILLNHLDYTRRTALMKCEGLSDEDARRAVLPTSPLMTMSGIVSHLRWVEWSWIHVRLLGSRTRVRGRTRTRTASSTTGPASRCR